MSNDGSSSEDAIDKQGLTPSFTSPLIQLRSVSACLKECMLDYKRILDSTLLVRCTQEVPVDLWHEQYMRLERWASNIGAYAQDNSSLEYRLREAPSILSHVNSLICSVQVDIKGIESYVHQMGGGTEPDDANSNSDSDSTTMLQELYTSVDSYITDLLKVSIIIRNSTSHERIMQLDSDAIAETAPWFIQHVREKFPGCDTAICERLGRAIARRRAEIEYRRKQGEKRKRGLARFLDEQDHEEEKSQTPTKFTDYAEVIQPQQDDNITETTSQSGYSDLDTANLAGGLPIPPPPRESADGKPFDCPYCFNPTSIQGLKDWRRHVLRDALPYICVCGECSTGDNLYASRREYYKHLRRAHAASLEVKAGRPCMLCHEVPLETFSVHLSHHLIQLALFSLQPYDAEVDEDQEVTTKTGFEGSDTASDSQDVEDIADTSDPPSSSGLPNPNIDDDDEVDVSFRARCQRCRKHRKGCDRQRPCQRCKDAGIGAEGCISGSFGSVDDTHIDPASFRDETTKASRLGERLASDSVEEHTPEAQLMADIHKNATKVNTWIGEDTKDTGTGKAEEREVTYVKKVSRVLGDTSTDPAEKRGMSKAARSEIFREVVLAKVREMKDKESTDELVANATRENERFQRSTSPMLPLNNDHPASDDQNATRAEGSDSFFKGDSTSSTPVSALHHQSRSSVDYPSRRMTIQQHLAAQQQQTDSDLRHVEHQLALLRQHEDNEEHRVKERELESRRRELIGLSQRRYEPQHSHQRQQSSDSDPESVSGSQADATTIVVPKPAKEIERSAFAPDESDGSTSMVLEVLGANGSSLVVNDVISDTGAKRNYISEKCAADLGYFMEKELMLHWRSQNSPIWSDSQFQVTPTPSLRAPISIILGLSVAQRYIVSKTMRDPGETPK